MFFLKCSVRNVSNVSRAGLSGLTLKLCCETLFDGCKARSQYCFVRNGHGCRILTSRKSPVREYFRDDEVVAAKCIKKKKQKD